MTGPVDDIYFIDYNSDILRVGGSSPLSVKDLLRIPDPWQDGSVIAWRFHGQTRILPYSIVETAIELHRSFRDLCELGRSEASPTTDILFTWAQTISLEDYFDQLRQEANEASDDG